MTKILSRVSSSFASQFIFYFRFSMNTGHYTQLVWAKTTLLGCGFIKYTDGDWKKNYLACNYGPAGNWQDQPVYEVKDAKKPGNLTENAEI